MDIAKLLLIHIKEQNHEELDKLFLEEPETITQLHTLINGGYVMQVDDDFEITVSGLELLDMLLLNLSK